MSASSATSMTDPATARDGRRILHIDMDAYFAALEAQACPPLRGKPVVVGALPGTRGVVASASYEARAFGIRAGMPAAQARRLCPQAEFVPCHPRLYIDTTRRILEHLLAITPQVEMFSIDEAYLDLTDPTAPPTSDRSDWKAAARLARDVSGSVARTFGLTCSIGVGPNKVIAKMAAKLDKPSGITLLGSEAFRRRLWHRPVEDLYGVGPRIASSLMILGIETIGELAETPAAFLRQRFGLYGEALHAIAWGWDDTPVRPVHAAPAAKSLGHEHTLARDLETPEEALGLLLALAERVGEDVRREGYAGRCVVIRIRYSDFSTLTRQRVLPVATQETRDFYRLAKDLFLTNYCGDGIRLLGLTAAQLQPTEGREQLRLFPEERRGIALTATLDRIRDQFGHESILPAGALGLHRAPSSIGRGR